MPDFIPPEADSGSQGFVPPEAKGSQSAPSETPVQMPTQGSAWERMTQSLGQSQKQAERAVMGISAEDQASTERYKKAWDEAKTPEDRMDLVKDWMWEQKDKIAQMGIKGGAPLVGQRLLGPVGGFAGGVAGEVLGNLYANQPTTLGGATGAGIRGLSMGATGATVNNFLKWAGLDVAAQEAQSLIDTGKLAETQRLAESAKNAAAAALVSKAVDTGSRAASQARAMGEDAVIEHLKNAHDAGLVLNPNKYAGNVVTKGLDYVAGRSNVEQAASIANAPKVDAMVRQQANLPQGVKADATNFELLRIAEAAPYRKLSSISKPAAAEVENWRNLQGEATDWADKVKTAETRQQRELFRNNAKQAQADADASFAKLQNYANKAGAPELTSELKEARIRIAELHAIEKGFENKAVLRNFNALTLGEMFNAGVPLRDNMRIIGAAAAAMPEVFGDPTKMSGAARLARAGVMGAGGLAGAAGGGPIGAGVAMGATYAAPKVAQNIILNPFVQGATAIPKYGVTEMTTPASLLQFATRNQ